MATVVVQSNKPGQPAVLHRLCHALACADRVLVTHVDAHTTIHAVAHGTAHDVACDIAFDIARSVGHEVLLANSFLVMQHVSQM